MATSPTQLTLRDMRGRGYHAEIVEKYNSFTRTKNDLLGFVDVLCFGTGEIVGVQTTSYSNLSARLKKIREHENFPIAMAAGMRVIAQGWRKNKSNRWECREVELTAEDMA